MEDDYAGEYLADGHSQQGEINQNPIEVGVDTGRRKRKVDASGTLVGFCIRRKKHRRSSAVFKPLHPNFFAEEPPSRSIV